MSARAYIALGANLNDPPRQLQQALTALSRLPGVSLRASSRIYRTAPWGDPAQPDYANAVAAVDTTLGPQELLGALLRIERAAGRTRSGQRRNEPRTLDLDLLAHGAQLVDEPGLQLPHPRLVERAFVLVPLLEIAPELELPGLGTVRAAWERLGAPVLSPWSNLDASNAVVAVEDAHVSA